MQTFEMNPDVFDPRTRAAADADARLYIEFYMHYERDEDASVKEGRPIFRDCEFMRITVPGDRNNILERAVGDLDRRRFAARYTAWKQSGEQTHEVGTPLDQWPLVTRSQVEELRYFQIRTVEHLSNANDQACQRIPGLTQLRDKAQAWLAATKDTKAAEKLAADLKERDDKILAQGSQLEHLQHQVADLLAERQDGRKRA